MMLPSSETPVATCLELAAYASRMLGEFPEEPQLIDLSQRMSDSAHALDVAERAYAGARRELALARAALSIEAHRAERTMQRAQRLAEGRDGHRHGGVIGRVFAATGKNDVALLDQLREFETRLIAVQDEWPRAVQERAAIADSRARYQTALHNRSRAQRTLRRMGVARRSVRIRFAALYAEIVAHVKDAFPHDCAMQRLFFDRVRLDSMAPGATLSGTMCGSPAAA